MDFALSQRRPDRHPVGLLVVVGLHVVLAAALLSAKLVNKPPAQVPFVPLTPLDPVKPVEQKPVDLPKPSQTLPRQFVIPTPLVETDRPPETVSAKVDDHPTPIVVAAIPVDANPVHEPPLRMTARAARISADDARCRPEYPAAAARAGVIGTTRIRFSVDATGRISGSQIVQSSGSTRENRMMDKAAADALAQCPVQVGTDEAGRPMGTTTEVTYQWSLN